MRRDIRAVLEALEEDSGYEVRTDDAGICVVCTATGEVVHRMDDTASFFAAVMLMLATHNDECRKGKKDER